ncbi:unnamed protein product [Gadus morhua 'NCC']
MPLVYLDFSGPRSYGVEDKKQQDDYRPCFFDTVSMNIHRPVDGATSFEVGEGETASRDTLIMPPKKTRFIEEI